MNCEGKRADVALVALNMKIVHLSTVLHSSNFAHGRADRPADKILRVVSAVSPQNVPRVYVHDGREERVSLRAAEAKMILCMLPDSPRWCRPHGGHEAEAPQHSAHLFGQPRRDCGISCLLESPRVDRSVALPRTADQGPNDVVRRVHQGFRKVFVGSRPAKFSIEEFSYCSRATGNPTAMACTIPHIDDDIEQKRQRFLEKAGQIVFVCGDAETNVTIAAGKSLGDIQSEQLGSSFIDLDGLRKRTGSWMREDGSELVPPNEHLLVNLDRPPTAIREYLRHLDRRHHLVVNPQGARTNPFRRTPDHDMPDAVHAIVTEPVSIVSEDTMSRCHSDWDHAVCSQLQERPLIRSLRSRQDSAEPALVG